MQKICTTILKNKKTMKGKIIYTLIVIIISLFVGTNKKSHAQITRGANSGEIYIANNWYIDNSGNLHDAIFRSNNNGETLFLKYESLYEPPADDMRIGRLLGDASAGALYNFGWNEFWVSLDYGENWEYKEDYSYAKYVAGYINGEIYRRSNNNLYRSQNFGVTFELIVETLTEPVSDVGVMSGELYGLNGSAGIGYGICHSTDYGDSFYNIPIDSAVAFWQVSGKYPEIFRGTETGELYLVSWWPGTFFKIFHSVDTGYTWTEQYTSDYIDLYNWGVQYTAGKEPGAFYVKRATFDPSYTHAHIYIDYSNDYGETFTTYFHDLDSLYTNVKIQKNKNPELSCYPNPFNYETTFSFNLIKDVKNQHLNIYNIYGEIIRKYPIYGKTKQQWDGRDSNGEIVPSGIYIYNIRYGNISSQFYKTLYIH